MKTGLAMAHETVFHVESVREAGGDGPVQKAAVEVFTIGAGEVIIPKPRRVTIKDVAAAAGVSTATVSNVVNDTGKFSRVTKERVRAAIERTTWEPNMHARNLAKTPELSVDDVE